MRFLAIKKNMYCIIQSNYFITHACNYFTRVANL